MQLPRPGCVKRRRWILAHCVGKSVLHLGCADRPFTQGRFIGGKLLHKELMTVAAVLHGVDASAEDVAWLREQGVEGVFVHDCERMDSLCTGTTYDVIVAGEVMEHLSNPGMFLKTVGSLLRPDGALLLTTVNATPVKRIPRLLWRHEVVHPDHVCYYSYSTLTALLARFGWSVEQFNVYWRDVGLLSRAANRVLEHLPFMRWYADGFALLCRTVPPSSSAGARNP